MSRGPKDAEIRRVASEIDALLDDLRASVDALNAVLQPPAPSAEDERLVPQ
jgi:hypothetical protein